MEFKSNQELEKFLMSQCYLSSGSQGECYTDFKNVYKIYTDYEECESDMSPIFDENMLRNLSSINNPMYIFANNIIKVNGKLAGCIMPYIKAINLTSINPITFPLNYFQKMLEEAYINTQKLSKDLVKTEDVLYNIMIGKRFYVIDTQDYMLGKEKEYSNIFKNNKYNIDLMTLYFLVDGLFNDVVNNCKILKELYEEIENYESKVTGLVFLKELRYYLSSLAGKEINYLKECSKYRDRNLLNHKYIRDIELYDYKQIL